MAVSTDQRSKAAGSLAARLRDLREREFMRLTQEDLARALGGTEPLSGATISTWENPSSGRLPPERRLAFYARLFCTRRSITAEGPRLLDDEELTEEELGREAQLHSELLELRERARYAVGDDKVARDQLPSIWRFAPREPVSIVCSDAVDPPPYADPAHLNYSRYARHADLDTLIEVYGQIKADNPVSTVRIMPSEWLWADHALNHLILIGGETVVTATKWFFRSIPLPVAQAVGDTYIFRCEIDEEVREFASLTEDGNLVEDVGLFARCPHPNIPGRTVTLLSGITSRGVQGAALCFTDWRVKEVNEQYLSDRFGAASMYCVLMRIPVVRHTPLPPNLTHKDVRLYEWSDKTGAHW